MWLLHVTLLLTLTWIGRAEGYYIQVFCLYVCVSVPKMYGQLTTLALWSSYMYQQNWKLYKDQNKNKLFLTPFGYKVMTIFYSPWLLFHHFQKTSGSKGIHWNTIHLVWMLSLLNHSLKSSIIELMAATTSSWL